MSMDRSSLVSITVTSRWKVPLNEIVEMLNALSVLWTAFERKDGNFTHTGYTNGFLERGIPALRNSSKFQLCHPHFVAKYTK